MPGLPIPLWYCWPVSTHSLRTPCSQDVKEFPQRGGATGSIRFYPEIEHAANAGSRFEKLAVRTGAENGLAFAVQLLIGIAIPLTRLCWWSGLVNALELLKGIADEHEHVSYADLFQLASGTAVEVCCSVFAVCQGAVVPWPFTFATLVKSGENSLRLLHCCLSVCRWLVGQKFLCVLVAGTLMGQSPVFPKAIFQVPGRFLLASTFS